jgi:hypothetical protein
MPAKKKGQRVGVPQVLREALGVTDQPEQKIMGFDKQWSIRDRHIRWRKYG